MLPKWNHVVCDLLRLDFFHSSECLLELSQAVACINSLFLFIAEKCFMMWMDHILLNCSPMVGHSGSFQLFGLMNKAVMNLHVQVLHELFSTKCQTVFLNGCTILRSRQMDERSIVTIF